MYIYLCVCVCIHTHTHTHTHTQLNHTNRETERERERKRDLPSVGGSIKNTADKLSHIHSADHFLENLLAFVERLRIQCVVMLCNW